MSDGRWSRGTVSSHLSASDVRLVRQLTVTLDGKKRERNHGGGWIEAALQESCMIGYRWGWCGEWIRFTRRLKPCL